jgi:hypothetical protein
MAIVAEPKDTFLNIQGLCQINKLPHLGRIRFVAAANTVLLLLAIHQCSQIAGTIRCICPNILHNWTNSILVEQLNAGQSNKAGVIPG